MCLSHTQRMQGPQTNPKESHRHYPHTQDSHQARAHRDMFPPPLGQAGAEVSQVQHTPHCPVHKYMNVYLWILSFGTASLPACHLGGHTKHQLNRNTPVHITAGISFMLYSLYSWTAVTHGPALYCWMTDICWTSGIIEIERKSPVPTSYIRSRTRSGSVHQSGREGGSWSETNCPETKPGSFLRLC